MKNARRCGRNFTKQTKLIQENLCIALEGRLDTSTAPELEAAVSNLDGIKNLEFDFEKLEYVSSAGLRVLLATQKVMNSQGGMKITHVNETIMEVFEITGFADILSIEQCQSLVRQAARRRNVLKI